MHLRASILAIACSALTPAMAGAMPGGGNSSTPACISLVGWNNGSASPRGTFEAVNGTLIGSPTASAYDLDGHNGVGANDLSLWLTEFGSGLRYGRSDYDCSGGLCATSCP